MSPPPEITNVLEATQRTVQIPRWARVRLPVVADPARYIVTDVPWVMVMLEALLL